MTPLIWSVEPGMASLEIQVIYVETGEEHRSADYTNPLIHYQVPDGKEGLETGGGRRYEYGYDTGTIPRGNITGCTAGNVAETGSTTNRHWVSEGG